MTDGRLVILLDTTDGRRVEIGDEDVPLQFMVEPGNVVTLEDPEAVAASLHVLVAQNPGGIILLTTEIYVPQDDPNEEWKSGPDEDVPDPRRARMYVMARNVAALGVSLLEE